MLSPVLRYPKSLWGYNPIPGGCVFYAPLWHPNMGSPTFKSIDPYGHLCTVTDAPMGYRGRIFDGDDKIDLGNKTIWHFSTAFSLAIWVKFDAIDTTEKLISKRFAAEFDGYDFFRYTDEKFYLQGGDGVSYNSIAVATTNTYTSVTAFYFVVATFDGTGRLYVDGVADGTDTSDPLGESSKNLYIGDSQDDPNPLSGTIGDVWLYDRALSPAEITYMYNATRGRYS